MNTAPAMNFVVDRENKKINVERSFSAPLGSVWAAWTQPALLDQWWAPKPWRTETKTMNFVEGGQWHYAMVGPAGEKHWSLRVYKHIDQRRLLSFVDAFCDENGIINAAQTKALWDVTFIDEADTTAIQVTISFDELPHLDMLLQMGFKGGFTMGLANLDQVLKSL